MGYLDNTSITVDAILTNKGRELLAQGGNAFNVTQFALGDDEIDYTLWNPADTRGSAFYGSVIENMPVTEAIPDQTKALKFRLLSLPGNNQQYIPKVSVTPATATSLAGSGGTITFNVVTSNIPNANSSLGYTAILGDDSFGSFGPSSGQSLGPGSQAAISSDAGTLAVVGRGGFDLQLAANPSLTDSRSTTITFFGNETGGEVTVEITQLKRPSVISANTASS